MEFVAETGYRFLELVKAGASLKDADMRSYFARPFEYGTAKPESELELALAKSRSMRKIYDTLSSKGYLDMFDINGWPLAHRATEYAIKEESENGPNTFLYYFLVGLTIYGRGHQIQYCECCGWRFKRIGNSKYCSSCSSNTDEKNAVKTTRTRQQKKIFEALKDTLEYQSFIELRPYGENYPLLRLIGKAPRAVKNMHCDLLDYTPFENYRDAKVSLAALWDEFRPNERVKRTLETDAALIELAKQGHTKASAAQQLGMSRAGVTKACQRNSRIAQAFLHKS